MASPVPVYGPRQEVALTGEMAAEIAVSAASTGVTRSEWIRVACTQRLERERRTRSAS